MGVINRLQNGAIPENATVTAICIHTPHRLSLLHQVACLHKVGSKIADEVIFVQAMKMVI